MQEMQDELEDLRDCGLGNCKPAFLQSCANIKVPILYNTYTQLFIFNAKMAFLAFHLSMTLLQGARRQEAESRTVSS